MLVDRSPDHKPHESRASLRTDARLDSATRQKMIAVAASRSWFWMSPLCEHVGSFFEYVDRHDNHGDGTSPLAHHPVTSFYVSGPVRFPSKSQLSSSFRFSPTAVSSALTNHSACPLHSNNRASIPVHTRPHDRIGHLRDLSIARQCFLSR
jgi:hypothetical protein